MIIKPLNGRTETDVKASPFSITVTWEQILPAIEHAIMLRPDEIIDGLIINGVNVDKGFGVAISRKLGRKPGNTVMTKKIEETDNGIQFAILTREDKEEKESEQSLNKTQREK